MFLLKINLFDKKTQKSKPFSFSFQSKRSRGCKRRKKNIENLNKIVLIIRKKCVNIENQIVNLISIN